jgi:hypothetical protein
MRAKELRLLVLALVVVAGVDCAAGQGRGVPGNVSFFSARDGNNEIFLMDWVGVDRFD